MNAVIRRAAQAAVEFDSGTAKSRRHAALAGTTVLRLSLAAGAVLEPHLVPERCYYFVLSGRGRLVDEGYEEEFGPDDSVLVMDGDERGWTALGEEPLELLLLRGV